MLCRNNEIFSMHFKNVFQLFRGPEVHRILFFPKFVFSNLLHFDILVKEFFQLIYNLQLQQRKYLRNFWLFVDGKHLSRQDGKYRLSEKCTFVFFFKVFYNCVSLKGNKSQTVSISYVSKGVKDLLLEDVSLLGSQSFLSLFTESDLLNETIKKNYTSLFLYKV